MNWHDVFEYKDGFLYWKIKVGSGGSTRIPGDVAGSIKKRDGYTYVKFMRKSFMAHRVIYEIINGDIPIGMEIDHINHDRSDNRI